MMTKTLPTRELITLDGLGVFLRGTYHPPHDLPVERGPGSGTAAGDRSLAPSPDISGRLAVVFVNALSTPRAGCSDTAVYWADSFAALGYPTFRLDLPGLGDTDGELPVELVNYITAGGHAPVLAAKVRELVQRYNLRGVVLAGLCAGSISSLFAASERRECKGLILLDPYFHLPKWMTPKVRPGLVHWSRRTRLGKFLRYTYDRLRERPWTLRGNAIPRNANFDLLGRWKQIASKGMPILILKSPGIEPRPGQFNYMQYVLDTAGRDARVVVETIEDTDHSFANRSGREAVRLHAERFLAAYFPRMAVEAPAPASESSAPALTKHCEINSGYQPA